MNNSTLSTPTKLSHMCIFGLNEEMKTQFVKEYLSKMKNDHDAQLMILEPYEKYTEFKNRLEMPLSLFEQPKNVPSYIWYAVFAEILADTFALGNHGYTILKSCIKNLMGRKKEGNFFKELYQEVEYDAERKLEKDRRISFRILDEYEIIKSSLHAWIWHEEHPMNILDLYLSSISDEEKDHVYQLFNFDQTSKSFIMKYVLAYEYYYRKYNQKENHPLVIVLEEARLCFSKDKNREPLNTAEPLIETVIREARNFNMHIVFVSDRKEDLPEVVIDLLPNKVECKKS